MERFEQLKELYAGYLAEAKKVRKEASPWSSILGLGNDPRRNPCHGMFYENVGAWVTKFVESQPDDAYTLAVAKWMLEEPICHKNEEGYWFLYVSIGYIQQMIPLLKKEDCKVLAERLNELYPKIERMPLQQETYKKLCKAAK